METTRDNGIIILQCIGKANLKYEPSFQVQLRPSMSLLLQYCPMSSIAITDTSLC